jgi:hypothetical protein
MKNVKTKRECVICLEPVKKFPFVLCKNCQKSFTRCLKVETNIIEWAAKRTRKFQHKVVKKRINKREKKLTKLGFESTTEMTDSRLQNFQEEE